jgi:hypothetical protein
MQVPLTQANSTYDAHGMQWPNYIYVCLLASYTITRMTLACLAKLFLPYLSCNAFDH